MAFGNHGSDNGEVLSEINMTPLVDVMLVLLVIFILTVPVLTHSVKLALPQAASTRERIEPKNVTLSVEAAGKVYWDQQAVAGAELEKRLAAAAHSEPQPQLRLRADRKVEYQYVARLMAAAQRAGIKQIGFVTEPER
jgi:biopolymer transport protein ExbD